METATATPETAPVAKPKKKAKAKPGTPKATQNKAKRAPKEGLRVPQIRILRALEKANKPLTRNAIVEKVTQGDSPTATGYSLGPTNPDLFAKYQKECGYPCLLLLKYVKMHNLDIDGVKETVFEITAAGRKALEKAPPIKKK